MTTTEFRTAQTKLKEVIAELREIMRNDPRGLFRLEVGVSLLQRDPERIRTMHSDDVATLASLALIGFCHVHQGVVESQLMEAGEL